MRGDTIIRDIKQHRAELEEGGLIEGLREDVGHLQFGSDPVRLRNTVKILIASISEPILIMASASSSSNVLNVGDSRRIVTMNSDREMDWKLIAIGT